MPDPTRVQQLEDALRLMAYGYLRIQETGPTSAFAARAYRQACELVDVDPAEHHLWAVPPAPTAATFEQVRQTLASVPPAPMPLGTQQLDALGAAVMALLADTGTPTPGRFRVGNSLRITVYKGPESSDVMGMMLTPEYAALVVDALNRAGGSPAPVLHRGTTTEGDEAERSALLVILPVPPSTPVVVYEDRQEATRG